MSIGTLVVPLLCDSIYNGDGSVNLHILPVLGRIRDAQAIEALLAVLQKADRDVGWKVADALF